VDARRCRTEPVDFCSEPLVPGAFHSYSMPPLRHLDDQPFVGVGGTGPTLTIDEHGCPGRLDLNRNRAEPGCVWRWLLAATGWRRWRRSACRTAADDGRTAGAGIQPIRLDGRLRQRFH